MIGSARSVYGRPDAARSLFDVLRGRCLAILLTVGCWPLALHAEAPPNFVLIVADDLGFSDLGCFGGEIHTPNLDRLAVQGQRFTNFYVSLSCSPSRAMLLSGLDNHVVGLGNMYERTAPNQQGLDGYEGVLRTDVTTIADALRQQGYHTYMTGKWHLGHSPAHIPAARGFERSFALLNSAGSHFDLTGYKVENEVSEFTQDETYLRELPRDYYSSKTFTDKLIDFIEADRADGKPFFAYLAYQAPHDPLQVPDRWLRRYKGHYDQGWDASREARMTRMKELGILPEQASAAPRLWFIPAWEDLTGIAQVQAARKMEIYAAMVEYMDSQIGRLLDYLESHGLADDTYVLFLSDNGPEGNDSIATAKRQPATAAANFFAQNYRTDFASWGRKDSYMAYGQAWAQVSATPFYMFKGSMFEGGIRSPLIVWHRDSTKAGAVNTEDVLHVSDVAPTLLDLAGLPVDLLHARGAGPRHLDEQQRAELQAGQSWRALLGEASKGEPRSGLGMEIWGGRVYRQGPWKLTWMHRPFGTDDWQLFHVIDDPAERVDLSARHPEIRERMIEAWNAYARSNNVVLPDRTDYDGMEDRLPPRPPVESPGWPRGQEPNWTSDEDEPSTPQNGSRNEVPQQLP